MDRRAAQLCRDAVADLGNIPSMDDVASKCGEKGRVLTY